MAGAEGGARAAAVVEGRGDDHVVTVLGERHGQGQDPGGVDAVVVGHENARHLDHR